MQRQKDAEAAGRHGDPEVHTDQKQLETDLLDLLPRIQREGVLGQPDLQVGVPKLGLSRLVEQDLPVLVLGHRVEDDAVVTRRHHDHVSRREEHSDKSRRRGTFKTGQEPHPVPSRTSLTSRCPGGCR